MFPLRFHLSEGSAAIRTCPAEPQVCDCRGQALPSSAARGGTPGHSGGRVDGSPGIPG